MFPQPNAAIEETIPDAPRFTTHAQDDGGAAGNEDGAVGAQDTSVIVTTPNDTNGMISTPIGRGTGHGGF